jgi:hypothetical protein
MTKAADVKPQHASDVAEDQSNSGAGSGSPACPEDVGDATIKSNSNGRPPLDRGGAPRNKRSQPAHVNSRSPATPRQLIVAENIDGVWELFVDFDCEDVTGLRVVQGDSGQPLTRTANGWFGPLRSLTEPIRVLRDLSETWISTPFGKKSFPLYFRLSGEGCARQVSRLQRGHCLGIVPEGWTYDSEQSGVPIIEPEPAGVEGYIVHHFSLDQNPRVVFYAGAQPVQVESTLSGYWLTGALIDDPDDDYGPLFGNEGPLLKPTNGASVPVKTIVIGVEGPGRGKWRSAIESPTIGADGLRISDSLPGSGWFFVRLYDGNGQMIDSMDFRYVRGLEAINIDIGRTDRCSITFRHDGMLSVGARGKHNWPPPDLSALTNGTEATFHWSPSSQIRWSHFDVVDREEHVPVNVNVDQLCWAVVNEAEPAGEPAWGMSPLPLKPEDFSATSELALWIRHRETGNPLVGFGVADRRRCSSRVDGIARVRLYEFSGASQLSSFGTHVFSFWSSPHADPVDLATVDVVKKCPWCETVSANKDYLVDHIISQHHEKIFEEQRLGSDQLIGPAIPKRISVCLGPECGKYFPHDPLEKAIDKLSRHHDESNHPGSLSVQVIEERAKIERVVGVKNVLVWRCQLPNCKPLIVPSSDDESALTEKRSHFKDEHFYDVVIHA